MAEKDAESFSFSRRGFLKGSLAASALLALSGCKSAASASDKKGGTVKWYINNPKSIDPYGLDETEGTMVAYQLFDGLVRWNYDASKLEPLIAKSWEGESSGKVFTFHLRSGVKFHNGEPVDAQSFKRSWERLCNPKTSSSPSPVSYHLALVKGYDDVLKGKTKELAGLSCPDDHTFKVELSAPYADFPLVCTHPALVPLPKASKDYATFSKAPIGNGPFKMNGKWEDGQHIALTRFDGYWGKKALPAAVYFRIIKDLETAFREFQAGNLDVANIPTAQLKDVIKQYGEAEGGGYKASPKHQVIDGPQVGTYYILLNNADPLLKDPLLRRALSLGINRQSICDNLFAGTRKPASDIVPPAIAGYKKGAWKWSHYDRAAAEKLLDSKYPKSADGKRNITFSLTYNLDGGHREIMESVIADWESLGIKVKSSTRDWASCIADFQAKKYQAGRLSWYADYPIMDNFMFPLFYSQSSDNLGNYADSEIDKEISLTRSIMDPKQRLAAFQKINEKIGDAAPVIPVMYFSLRKIASKKVKSLTVRPDGEALLSEVKLA